MRTNRSRNRGSAGASAGGAGETIAGSESRPSAVNGDPFRLEVAECILFDGQVHGRAGLHVSHTASGEGEYQVFRREDFTVSARVRTDPSAIKPGSYVGAAAVPGKNGALVGVEVFIFPEASRGSGEGHRPIDLLPDSTMTNATVADEVIAADGKTLKLTYKGSDQTLVLTPETLIFTFATGSLADLKPGSAVNLTIEKDASGDFQSKRVTVDR